MRAVLLWLLLSASAVAQFTAKAEVVTAVTGLINPRVVGNQVLFDAGSEVKLSEVAIITVDPNAKSALVVVMKSIFEQVQLRPSADGTYGFSGRGQYAVNVTIVDQNNHLSFEQLTVTLSDADPLVPVDPVTPPTPEDERLSELAKKSREAMRAYVESIATNFKVLAMDTKSGKYKMVADASVAANTMDLASRLEFKRTMNGIMQPVLGDGQLEPSAIKVFDDISTGFGGVK